MYQVKVIHSKAEAIESELNSVLSRYKDIIEELIDIKIYEKKNGDTQAVIIYKSSGKELKPAIPWNRTNP